MKNKKGFTLIELLAVIVVLAIVLSIIGYIVVTNINKAKKESYKVTISNIENNANDYLLENSNRLFFLTNNTDDENERYEYQCVTVQNLIDFGYLKDKVTESYVSDDKHVDKNDYIYIERNYKTKAIEKVVYANEKYIIDICNEAVKAIADINILVEPDSNTWSKQKNITITYKIQNLNDVNDINKYQYNYNYERNTDNKVLKSESIKPNDLNTKSKTFTVTSNGSLSANIKIDNDVRANANIDITTIDRVKPIISINSENKTVKHSVTIPITVTDTATLPDTPSGVKYTSFTKGDINLTIGGTKVTPSKLIHEGNGNYTLTVNSDTYNGEVVISIAAGKVSDNAGNGNVAVENFNTGITFDNIYTITYDANGGTNAPEAQSYQYSATEEINLSSDVPTKDYYTFKGWATSATSTKVKYNAGASYPRNVTKDITLYAVWRKNYIITRYDMNGGSWAGSTNEKLSVQGSLVAKNGSVDAWKYAYDKTGVLNLANYNWPEFINITRSGYHGSDSSTWCTQADGGGTCYSHFTDYDFPTHFASKCPAKDGDCILTLYVNWFVNSSGGDSGGGSGGGGCDYCCQCSCCCYGGCGGTSSSCFLAGTKVITPYGLRNIEDIKVGDLIYSKNMTTNEVEIDTVKVNYKRVSHENIYVIYDEVGYVKTTPDHPFYVKKYGWKKAEDLDINDILIDLMGNEVQIKDIKIISNINGINVYNLQATKNHNYFVGMDSILVHNRRCFVKGTKILSTLNGTYKSIEDIKVGDKVVTYDAKNNKNVESIVTETYTHKDVNSIVKITFDDKSILEMTMYHPLYTKNGWKSITGYNDYDILNIGDEVKTIGGWKKILNINVSMLKENIDTYTIKVKGSDSYYANEILAEGMN